MPRKVKSRRIIRHYDGTTWIARLYSDRVVLHTNRATYVHEYGSEKAQYMPLSIDGETLLVRNISRDEFLKKLRIFRRMGRINK